ncbi:cysteine synthase A [bacterium]|nr:cysteine synthase A [bacterium]
MNYKRITDFVGKTPLIHLPYFSGISGATILGKCEFMNPCASVKDRTALAMVEAAERDGLLKPGSVIIEATSGNTGIGLAFVGITKGYKVILTMPESMTVERRKLLKALGAIIDLTPAHLGMTGAIQRVEELKKTIPNAFVPLQFNNPANPNIHYTTTAPEIYKDTNGEVDVIVAGVGTGGTIAGVSRFMKEQDKSIEIVAVEPEDSAVLSGKKPGPHMIQGIGAGFVPGNIKTSDYDRIITVSNESAFTTAQDLAKHEGVLNGMSSGANLSAALTLTEDDAYKNKTIVIVLCDFGERYLSTTLFPEEEKNEN